MLKRRTRGHIIADLSINYVQRQVLLAGYTAEQTRYDYGIDLVMKTYNASGEPELGDIYLQVKATDVPVFSSDQRWLILRLERAHVESWIREVLPFIVVAYDAQADTAYWLYLQAYFRRQTDFDLSQAGETITVRFAVENVLSPEAARRFATFRNTVQNQYPEVIHYDEQ